MKFLDIQIERHTITVLMLKSFFVIMFGVLSLSPLVTPVKESPAALLHTPLPPDTGDRTKDSGQTATLEPATTTPPVIAAPIAMVPTEPVRLHIPSIALNDAVAKVGVNAKGEMDVPDGNTKDVGWYGGGTIPGNIGSAVIDAHVFAAFAKLQNIKVGNDIYVETDSGQKLHFVVSEIKTYKLADVPADLLFNRADTERLNLITCTGKLTDDRSTYDHRLVVYATLVHTE